MANKSSERMSRLSLTDKRYNWRARIKHYRQADLDEILEIERRVDNILIECLAEIIDDILPIGHKRKFLCEHYRVPRDYKCVGAKDEKM